MVGDRRNGRVRAICDCGGERWCLPHHLANGNTKCCKACIDYSANARKDDPKTKRPEYWVWDQMIRRCHDPRNKAFPGYGGRDIRVCEHWRTFENFFADMGPRPGGKREHSIERRDNDRGYEPDNCEWIPAERQAANRRSIVILAYNGETMRFQDIASERGWSAIEIETRQERLRRGWTPEQAIDIPLGVRR